MNAEKALKLTTGRDDWHPIDTIQFKNSDGQVAAVNIDGDEYTITVDSEPVFQGWESELEEIELLG